MSENKIKVSASTTSKAVRVNVSTPTLQGTVALSQDTSAYNAKIAEQWAISENIVLGKDYSSKYYANKAKENATAAQGISEAVKSDYNEFLTASLNSNEQLQTGKEEALTSLESARADAENSINNTKTTAISDIEFVADGEKKEIQGLVDDEKEEIKDLINTGKDELKESIGDVKVLTTLEIGDIGFTQMAIDESKGKRRILNGQVIIQEQYVQFTNIIKNSVALNQDLACTEAEWQTAATMSTAGICDKFVIDDEAGTIRLPKYPEYFIGGGIASVVGNGMTLGLMESPSILGGLGAMSNGSLQVASGNYGVPVDTGNSGTVFTSKTLGVVTDPTKSGIEAHLNDAELVKGTYFIQVATGAETEDNIINEIELNNPYSLGDSKYSPQPLNNLSWLKSEGQWNRKATYPSFYNWALINLNNGVEGFASSTGEYTDYDIVINPADETFRLPLLNGSETMPDKNARFNTNENVYTFERNCFCYATVQVPAYNSLNILLDGTVVSNAVNPTGTAVQVLSTNFVARRGQTLTHGSNIGNAWGVTCFPLIGNGSLYFYVGETVQNANLINAGRIEEKLAEKLDRSSVKAYIVETYVNGTSWYRVYSDGWCEQGGIFKPSNTWTNLTLNLLKDFSNTNYQIMFSIGDTTGNSLGLTTCLVVSKATQSLVYSVGGYNNQIPASQLTVYWYACGY